MSEVLLVLVLYCGQPVSAVISVPAEVGVKVRVGPVGGEQRDFFLDLAKKVEGSGGKVERIKVEEQVEGVRCPVAA